MRAYAPIRSVVTSLGLACSLRSRTSGALSEAAGVRVGSALLGVRFQKKTLKRICSPNGNHQSMSVGGRKPKSGIAKAKADSSVWRARSQCPDLREVVLLDAHIVGSGRNQFNPVLGTGGNISRRDLAAGFQKALAKAGKTDPKAQSHKRSRRKAATSPEEGTLKHTLWGERAQALAELPAGTWFPSANRAYNSGQRDSTTKKASSHLGPICSLLRARDYSQAA